MIQPLDPGADGRGPQWISPGVPTFAVVGRVNMGKSAVLAALLEEDDDAVIRISAEPGETTRCQRLSLVLDGLERLRFIDTPGFQQPIAALRAIRALADDPLRGPGPDTLAAFLERYRGTDAFVDECRLLAPLVEGAGVIYVVDPGVRLQDVFVAEIEILRLAAGPRLAVLNAHHRGGPAPAEADAAAWRDALGRTFNRVRTFDALAARYESRRELLAALNQIDERGRATLDATIERLDDERVQRRETAAEQIWRFLDETLRLRETIADPGDADDRKSAVAEATRRYYARIAAREKAAADALLDLYRHRHARAAEDAFALAGLDLSQAENWRRFGLTRGQLTAAGAALGAGAGGSVDVGLLGHTLGLGAVVGGGIGGAMAYFKGNALPTLRVAFGPLGRRSVGGGRLILGPPRHPNFAWVLLDSMLVRYRRVVARPHAARGDAPLHGSAEDGAAGDTDGLISRMPVEQRKPLDQWFRDVARGGENAERARAARQAIESLLKAIETGDD